MDNALKQTCKSVEKVQAFFTEGRLDDKRAAAESLLRAGDTTFFEGSVLWRICLDGGDEPLEGSSESLDCAMADLLSCLNLLASTHAARTHVLCSVARGETA